MKGQFGKCGRVSMIFRSLLAGAPVLACTPLALAETPLTVIAGYEAVATDNIRRQQSDERSDVIHRPYLMLGYSATSARAELATRYRLQARRYHRDSFGNDEVIQGRTQLDVELVPDQLYWATSHERSEHLLDRRNLDTPNNRRESDTIGTGLTYMMGHSTPNRLTAGVRGERYTSNRGFDDSDRFSGQLHLQRATSPIQNLGVRVQGMTVDFDSNLVPDYDRWSVQGTLQREMPVGSVELGVGYNEVSRSGLGSAGGLSLSGRGNWEPADGHVFQLRVSRQYTDRMQFASRGIPEFGDERDQSTGAGNVFEETSLGVGYRHARERWSWRGDLDWSDEDYDTVARDVRRVHFRLGVGYRVRPNLDLDMSARVRRLDFRDEQREDDFYGGDVRLRWSAAPRTSLSLQVGYDERDSDAQGRSYTEGRVLLGIQHRFF